MQKEEEILRATSIEAGKLEVRGPDGKVAASLFRGPKGEPVLSFFDDKGRARMHHGARCEPLADDIVVKRARGAQSWFLVWTGRMERL